MQFMFGEIGEHSFCFNELWTLDPPWEQTKLSTFLFLRDSKPST